ncbi:MAG TPA: hypothetical protein VGL02_19485, partial [Streptomyces sp.]
MSLARKARAAGIGAVAVAAAALFAAPVAGASPARPDAVHDSAPVFVQSDNLTANTVVAYHRDENGALSQSAVYPTGGRGGKLYASVVDHLASQGSLAYDRAHGLLYAVNAGSNSVTV